MPQQPPEFKANYEAGRSYLVKGNLLNAIIRWLTRSRLVPGDGIKSVETVNGEVWSVDPSTAAGVLPFQITVTADSLVAAAGVLASGSIAEVTESSPANGTWYLEAKVTINSGTGATTARSVTWVTTESTDTSTEFHLTIGEVDVVAGVPDPETIVNYTYGPLLAVKYGTPTDKWGVSIF